MYTFRWTVNRKDFCLIIRRECLIIRQWVVLSKHMNTLAIVARYLHCIMMKNRNKHETNLLCNCLS